MDTHPALIFRSVISAIRPRQSGQIRVNQGKSTLLKVGVYHAEALGLKNLKLKTQSSAAGKAGKAGLSRASAW